MQIPKSFLIGWAAVTCILPVCVPAADTDVQAKAREALRQKMNELQPLPESSESIAPIPAPAPAEKPRPVVRQKTNENRAPAPAATTPRPVPPEAIGQSPAPQKNMPAPSLVEKPTPAPRAAPPVTRNIRSAPAPVDTPQADSETIAKARDALHKKMDELQAQPIPEMAAPATPPMATNRKAIPEPNPAAPFESGAAPPVIRKRPVRPIPTPEFVTPSPSSPVPSVATPVEPKAVEIPSAPSEPRAAAPAPPATIDNKVFETPANARSEAEQAAQSQAVIQPKAEKKRKPRASPPPPSFQPGAGPSLNISADKQQRLAELLRRYQADELTPAQYHQERAKILAAP